MRAAILGLALGLPTGACYAFAPAQQGICHNAIIEAGEDCDDEDAEHCSDCRLVCAPYVSTTGCPPGRVCGADHRCRAPAGGFSADPIHVDVPGPEWLVAADLDGDHLAEVLAQHDGEITAVRLDPTAAFTLFEGEGRVTVADLDLDGAAEVLIGQAGDGDASPRGLAVLTQAQDDEGSDVAVARVLPTLRCDAQGRLVAATPAHDRVIDLVARDVAWAWRSGETAATPLDVALVSDPARLGTAIAIADIGGDETCPASDGEPAFTAREVAIAEVGADRVEILSTCGTDAPALTPLASVVLASPATLGAAGAFFVDVDADDRLDLVTQRSDGAVLVAWGVGDGTFSSDGPAPPSEGDGRFASEPVWTPDDASSSLLAVADVDADGKAEFVLSDALVAWPGTCDTWCRTPWPTPMSAAIFLDLDDDDFLDLASVHGSSLAVRLVDVDAGVLSLAAPHEFPLAGPGEALAIGDFNHDTVDDLAFIERDEDTDDTDGPSAKILYGGALDDWRFEAFGPFEDLGALVVDGDDTLVLRTIDAQGRAAGAFVRPGAVVADFGFRVHALATVRTKDASVAAALTTAADSDSARLVHLGFVAASLSPRDVVVSDPIAGLDADEAARALIAPIDLDGTTDALVLLASDDGGGRVRVAALDPATGTWSVTTSFALGPGFGRRALEVDETQGGAGSSIAIADVDGDGHDDVVATSNELLPTVYVLRATDGALSADASTSLFERRHFGAFEIVDLARWHDDALGAPQWLVGGDDGVGLATIDLERGELLVTDISSAHATAVSAADMDGDGLLDLVVGTPSELRIQLALEHVGID